VPEAGLRQSKAMADIPAAAAVADAIEFTICD
jgi:hypothetical protein